MSRLFPETIGDAIRAVARHRGRSRPAPALALFIALLAGLTLAGPVVVLACQYDDTAHIVGVDVDLADDSDDIDPLPVGLPETLRFTWQPPAAFSVVEFGGWIPNPGHPPATPPPILG